VQKCTEGIEASVTGNIASLVHDMRNQVSELTNAMKHSLTEVVQAVKIAAPGRMDDHASHVGQGERTHFLPQCLNLQATSTTTSSVTNHASEDMPLQTSGGSSPSEYHATPINATLLDCNGAVSGLASITINDCQGLGTEPGDRHNSTPSAQQLHELVHPNAVTEIRATTLPAWNTKTVEHGVRTTTTQENINSRTTHNNIPQSQSQDGTIQVRISRDQCGATMSTENRPNIDDGFVGVTKHQTARYFLSGIGISTKAESIRQYLSERSVSVSVIRMMKSKRRNSQSARINILRYDVYKVYEPDFWPSGVACRKWETNAMFSKRRDDYSEEYDDDM
jgi:hypothetical protein